MLITNRKIINLIFKTSLQYLSTFVFFGGGIQNKIYATISIKFHKNVIF